MVDGKWQYLDGRLWYVLGSVLIVDGGLFMANSVM